MDLTLAEEMPVEEIPMPRGNFGLRRVGDYYEVYFKSDPKEVLASSLKKQYASLCCNLANGIIQIRCSNES